MSELEIYPYQVGEEVFVKDSGLFWRAKIQSAGPGVDEERIIWGGDTNPVSGFHIKIHRKRSRQIIFLPNYSIGRDSLVLPINVIEDLPEEVQILSPAGSFHCNGHGAICLDNEFQRGVYIYHARIAPQRFDPLGHVVAPSYNKNWFNLMVADSSRRPVFIPLGVKPILHTLLDKFLLVEEM